MHFPLLLSSLLLAAGGVVMAVPAQAQFSIGPQLGLNRSSSPYEDETRNRTYNTTARTGVEAGVQASLQLGKWAVQPALLYSQKGFNIDDDATAVSGSQTTTTITRTTFRFNYLTLPFNLAYSLQDGGQGLQVFAGPYASLLLGGEQHYKVSHSYRTASSAGGGYEDYTADVKPGDYYSTTNLIYYSQRFDAGLQAGLGYRLGPTQLQLDYSLGLRNLGADYRFTSGSNTSTAPGPSYRNRAFQASVSYLFDFGH